MNHVKSLNRRASHEDNRSEIDIDNVLSGDRYILFFIYIYC